MLNLLHVFGNVLCQHSKGYAAFEVKLYPNCSMQLAIVCQSSIVCGLHVTVSQCLSGRGRERLGRHSAVSFKSLF